MWTLTGNDASLMLFVTQQPLEPDAFLDGHVAAMAERFEGTKVEPATLALEAATLPGKRLRMSVSGSALTQSVFALEVKDGRVLLLVLQDSPDDPRAATAESQALQALVMKTFKLKP
jgi:hypothetical protein